MEYKSKIGKKKQKTIKNEEKEKPPIFMLVITLELAGPCNMRMLA
jgi:hypothetical protein